jgi:transcriptional regulator with XRE-family HTH domain
MARCRTLQLDSSIGERIRVRRKARDWSLRQAGDRAGVAASTWKRVEDGELRTDRYRLADFAAALECRVTDLTGQPYIPADRALEAAHGGVQSLWQTLLETAPDEPVVATDGISPPMSKMDQDVTDLEERYHACDYAATGQMLAKLIPALHAAQAGPSMRAATLLMVRITYIAMGTLRNLGYPAESAFAAERCRQSAERLDEPVPLAVAEFVRAHAAIAGGSFGRAYTLASRAARELEPHLDLDTALDVSGMLHLTSGLAALVERPTDAFAHVAEARRLAEETGETTSWNMFFGPTNVDVWRVSLETDAGEPDRAIEAAGSVNISLLPVSRQSYYYVDLARAYTDLGPGHGREAERALLTADRISPQRVRSSPSAQSAARYLLEQSRRSSPLGGLCERMGIA